MEFFLEPYPSMDPTRIRYIKERWWGMIVTIRKIYIFATLFIIRFLNYKCHIHLNCVFSNYPWLKELIVTSCKWHLHSNKFRLSPTLNIIGHVFNCKHLMWHKLTKWMSFWKWVEEFHLFTCHDVRLCAIT